MTTSELQKNMGSAIQRVIGGETITLTSHKRPVARLVPVGGPEIHEANTVSGATKEARPVAGADGRTVRNRSKRNLKD